MGVRFRYIRLGVLGVATAVVMASFFEAMAIIPATGRSISVENGCLGVGSSGFICGFGGAAARTPALVLWTSPGQQVTLWVGPAPFDARSGSSFVSLRSVLWGVRPDIATFVPLWQPIVVGALVEGLLWRKRARRTRQGFCKSCGYDLRGSGGVCPECGSDRGRASAGPV